MKEIRSANILINAALEDAKAGSNPKPGSVRIFQRTLGRAGRIGGREAVRNILRQSVAYLLIVLFLIQSSAVVMASDRAYINSRAGAETAAKEADTGYFQQAMGWLFGSEQPAANETMEPPPPPPSTVSEAAISRHYPSLNGGTIDGSLRVFSGESYAINSQFHLNGDLYAVGTPNITVNSGASHGGVVNDGGSATPTGYGITLNSGVVLPGKIHTRANATALPSDIPASVPNPSGTRTVNVNSAADLNNIGNWATLRDLNVNPSNSVINVPPGNYGTFSMNGSNIRLVFSAGTYNFSGTINLNSGSNVQSNGAVTINIGQNLNLNNGVFGLGTGTASSDVKLNIIGSSVGVNNNSQVWAMMRAVNATVNLNAAIIRGHLIANYLNINSGQIVGDASPADTTQPALSITSPANNSTTTSATINVTGTASDAGSGIASVTVNNVAATYNASSGTWSFANLALAMGSNAITVKATDAAGNITTQTVTVTRQNPPDVTAPNVAITSPANYTTVSSATITVSGTASDTGVGATGINRVMVNGVQAAYNSAAGTWTISGVALNEGPNTITAVAYDNAPAPNSSQASITVTRFTPDTQAPAVAITSPANNSTVPDATVTVSGTVTDTGLNASGVNRVMVNGVQAAYNSAAGTWTISGVALNEGPNTITAVAYDNAPTPNSSQASITVTRFTPDTQAPAVAITSPANNSTVPDATITVSGTVTDTGLNASGVNRVMVNGVQAAYNSAAGTWTISGVALNEGPNTITAVAYDNAPTPNSSQASITVTRFTPDTQVPAISITSPADGTETYDAAVTITGTANDTGLNAAGISSVTVNGQNAVYDANTHQWTISGVALALGNNTITVVATDAANPANQAQAVIHITRKEIPAPTISITSPGDNSTTAAASITVAGLASAFDTGSNQIAQVTVNGNPAAYDPASGAWFLAGFSLNVGPNTVTATATDTGGRSASAQITVTRAPTNQPPVAVNDFYQVSALSPEYSIKLPYQFSASSYLSGSPFTSIIALAASADDKLYVADASGAVIAVDLPTRSASTVATLPFARPRNMVIADASFGGGLIVSDHNSEPSSTCCTGQVLKIDPMTGQVTTLSDGNPAYPGFADPFGLAFSPGGNFAAGVYVMDFEGSSPHPPNMFRIASDGTRTTFVSRPDIWSTDRLPSYMAFAPAGGFGGDLFVADGLGGPNPAIWRVNPQGNITSFVAGEPLKNPGIMKFGRGGIFGNDLYVFDNQLKTIFRITAEGTISVFARDIPVTETLTSMEFTPDGGSLFIGAGNKLIRVGSPASMSIAAPGVLANDTDNENDPLNATRDSGPAHGALTFNADGSFDYTADETFTGTDSFTYHAADAGASSNVATVTISNIVNQPPVINAGANQTVSLPSAANLNGTVSDDGLPSATLVTSWSKISGPGAVSFGDAAQPATTASFSALGTYVLRLTASDGELSIADDVTITVVPQNNAPVVNAGVDQTVTLPASVSLNGSASDDGQPAPPALSPVWSKVSGPGTVIFASPNSLQTSAEFSVQGTYVLRLAVSDSALTGTDDVTVTVAAEPAGCPIGTFVDYFNDNQFDNARWSIADPASPHVVSEQNQRLTITLAPNTAAYNSIVTNQAFDFANKSLSVDVVDPASQTGWVSTFVFLELDDNNSYRISAGAGFAVYEIVSGGASTQRLVKEYNYQPYWRMRHDPAAGQVIFETSANGVTWNEQHRVTPVVPLGALKVRLGTGAYGTGNSSPGQAAFDNVRLLSTAATCAPAVSITQPAENAIFATGEPIPVEASASDSDGTVTKVEFFDNGTKIGEAIAAPFVFNWTNASSGAHALTAKATDNAGATTVSAPVNITVAAPPTPICYASDNFNDNVIDRSKWLAPAADGQVYERNQRLEIVPFTPPYRRPDGSIAYNGYFSAAQCDFTGVETSIEIVQSTPFEYGVETDFRWTADDPLHQNVNTIGMAIGGPNLAMYYDVNGQRSITTIAPDPVAHRFWRIRHIPGTDEIAWETSPDSVAWTIQKRIPRPISLSSMRVALESGTYLAISNPGTAILDNFNLTRTASPNQAPIVNAGADQSIAAGSLANLAGTVTDDGLPAGSSVSATWSKVSGPGEVSFADAGAAATTAIFSQPGSYILRLTATDTELTASDEVTIAILSANQPPVADFSVPSAGGPVGLTVTSSSGTGTSNLFDESNFSNWTTSGGDNTGQFAKFEVIGGEQLIQGFKFQQGNFPTSYMVKDFIIQVSTTTSDDSAFSTVLTGTLEANNLLQGIDLPGAVHAKFVRLLPVTTHGGAPNMVLSTFQVIGAGRADSLVSLPGSINAIRRASPSLWKNGAAISRSTSYGSNPIELINGGVWKTNTKTNEFVVIKLAGDTSHLLRGIRMGGNYADYLNYWVRDFEVWVSNTVDDDAAFTKVLDGVKTSWETEDFTFPGGEVQAKYIKYVPKSSQGTATFIGTFAIEALAVEGPGIYSFSSDYEHNRVERAFDGNPQTAWYCAPGRLADQWVKLRLEGAGPQQIYGVKIGANNSIFGAFGPRDYQIRVSTTTADDSAFTVVHSGTLAATSAMQEIRFASPVDAKYVQFYWVNGYSDSWLSAYDLEVMRLPSDGAIFTNISSQSTSSSPAARILDLEQGPNNSQWESVGGQNTDQSLTLRLYNGEQFDIRHVALRPGLIYPQNSMSPREFDIQVSTTDDADTSFTTVFSGTAQPVDLLQHFYFPTVPAKYVRLFIRNNYGNSQIILNTFFVFAENTGATDARFFDRSADTDGSIVSYQWDFGDGSTGSGRDPVHTYAAEGIYNVSLTVTDSSGATNTTVKPYHAHPTLKADFAYSPVSPVESDWYPNTVYFTDRSSSRLNNAGGQAMLNTADADYPFAVQSNSPSVLYRDNGNYPSTIKFGSDYVLNYRTTKNVAVQNLPPGVDITDGKTVYWGESWTNPIIGLGDPGPADRSSLSGVWNFGDGTTSTCTNCTAASAQGNHSYTLPGDYTAVLTITDKDGGAGSDSANYHVIKHPTAVIFNQPVRNGNQLTIGGTLRDTYANVSLAGKPVQILLNGFASSLTTDANGAFQTTFAFDSGAQIGQIVSLFAEDDLYQGSSNIYSLTPVRDNPPSGTPSNGGTDFWLAFPANYVDGSTSGALIITSETDTSGTVTAPACGVNRTFDVTARTVTQIPIPLSCQIFNSNLVENLGIHVTAQAPVVVYGLNQRVFTTDAFLALPVNTLGREYYALAYGNQSTFLPSSQFGVVATENNTTVTITPSVTTDARQQGVAYQVNLNQGQTYLLRNTEVGEEKDLTGSAISADKPVAVFGGHQAATLPAPTICCADHLVEQMPPVNTWGKRFLLIPSATRTKGDYFRVVAAYDNTVIYLNGSRVATINKGQFFEKLVANASEVISTEPVMVGQYSTSAGFDTATYGGDPFMAIVPPYSQYLNHYTISTPNRFNNYINLSVPTPIAGQVSLDGTLIAAGQFTAIGASGFSSAQVPISIGTHNIDAPAPFGVLSYGYSTDEGYGYPGGMSLIPTVRSTNLTLTPETAAFGTSSQGCVTASLKDENNSPLGGRAVSFGVTGVNPTSGSGVTDASGQSQFCYTGANAGSDTITATFENVNATATFIWSIANQPPTVNAGSDQSITLPANASLSGSASDDGYPSNTLTYSWTKVSGSGDVTFGSPNALATAASFGLAGTYVLRLTVSDGELSASDDVSVTVAAGNVNQPPTANAGADQTAALNANLLRNPGAESELASGELPNWTEVQGNSWTRVSSTTGGGYPEARFGRYYLSAGSDAQAELRQDVDLRAFSQGINDGTLQFTWKAFIRSLPEAAPDGGTVIVEYRDAANQNTIASLNSGEITTTGSWHETEDTRVPPPGTGYMRIRLIATRHTGPTNDVFFDGLSLRAEAPIAAVLLDGTTTDDGRPAGSVLQSTWTRVSGPGPVSFADQTSADSPAAFTMAGTYVLRLTATDGDLIAYDDVTITINPANTAPAVNAGTDQTVTLPNSAQLSGSITDDGEPQGGVITTRWSKVSGPGAVTFSDDSVQNPTVSFGAAGTYVLRLFAEDGELEASDDVTVIVSTQNNPVNQPPTVEAGNNQTIQLPVNSVALSGTVSDDGLPNNTLTITWTKTSGQGNVSFTSPNSAQTDATFDAAGSYVLRLTVTDGQYTSFDEVAIIVNAAGQQNQPPSVTISPDQTITLSQQAILEALTLNDDGLPAGAVYTYQWSKVSGPGTVTFTNPTETGTYASFSEVGVYVVRLSASDSELTGSDDATVTVTEDQPAPAVEILTPDDGISITEPTAIMGTVTAGNWRLEYSLTDTADLNSRSWTIANSGTGAASGTLGTLDTTLMLNGTYDVRLITDNNGQISSDIISVTVEGGLKIGHFTVSFDDMSVPVAGIPIQIVRTYDSRDKRKGDFGYGWTLGVKNMRLEKNAVLGLKWYQTKTQTFIPTYCVEPTKPHIVSVTLPDGKVEKFEAGLQTRCQQAANITGGNVVFTPQAGARGKLEVIGSNEVAVAGSVPGPVDLIGFDGNGIFDRSTYKYTAKDGTEFVIDQTGGLQSVRDTNNNTLTISASGITHSSGTSISFTRDGQGRITAITDPAGVSNIYTYDAAGDLVSFKDRENNTTTFTYEPMIPHHLKSIIDPLGRNAVRNEYDASGRLLKHIDANGEEIVYTHDLTARAETVRDRLGNETRFEYDAHGNVLKKRDALGFETTFTYDADDNTLTETNALGKTTTNTYDATGNRLTTTDPLGNRNEFTYNLQGRMLTIKDARGNTTTNTFDTAGNLLTTKDAAGNVTTNIYNAFTGQLATMRDALNNTTTLEYTGNYVTKQTDAQGNIATFGYDANGNRNSQTVKRTNSQGQIESITTSSEFDNLNRLTKTIMPDGTFTRIEYNAIGMQKATIDQAGRRTEFEYDTQGRLIKTIYSDGKFEESTYDEEGRKLTSKDRAGRVTTYEYDVLGRLKKTTDPDGTFVQTAYDAAGRVLSSTDAAGNTTTNTYDDAGRRTQLRNALNQLTEFTFDANGNQLTVKDALNQVTTNVYDDLNRREKTIFADGSFTQVTFDELGRQIAKRDQAGKVTQFTFDSLSRMTKVKDALNQETRYEFNEVGQQIKQIDALNHETRYEYDKLGRKTKRILPLGQVETYTFGATGNLESRTDFNGKTTTFTYDSMRRLLSKTPDPSLGQPAVSYTYNDLGQRATMTDASGTTNYAYNTRNRLASKQTSFGTLSYTYTGTGNIATVRSSNANGVSVDYSYDELNRPKDVKDNRLAGNQTTTYTYDAAGNLQSYTYPNQVTASYAYNNLNRLTTMTVSNTASALASYQYTLGPAGNRTQVVENGVRTVAHVYDDLYRLTEETIAGSAVSGNVGYAYDAVGNRLNRTSSIAPLGNQTSTFDANDRFQSDGYDANGNTKISNGRAYNYDFENHLTSTSDGVTIVYDGDGNRVSKTAGGVTTNYLVDTNNLTGYAQVVEEIQNSSVVKAYTYGLDLISQRTVGGSVSFYGYDGHGSVRNLTDSSGQITDTYAYDAFGSLIESSGTTANNYLYAGEQFDADLGLYYNRARYLNVGTGRFISMDSYGGSSSDPSSLHKYLYANDNPANYVDPSGKFSISETLSAAGINGILNTIATLSIKGAIYGAAIGGADAYFRGDDVLEGAFEGGVIGAILGPLAQVRFLGPVLVSFGFAGGVYGVFDALEQGNTELAAFRAIVVYAGIRTFVQPTPEPYVFPNSPPKSGGRLGNPSTRAQNEEIITALRERDWVVTHGGSAGPEEYLPPLAGTGPKGSNYPDITATKNGRTLRINTVDTRADGVTPTTREAAAAALIRKKTPGDHLLLVPKSQ